MPVTSAKTIPSLLACASIVLSLPVPARAQIRFLSDLEIEDPACFSLKPADGCNGWMGIHDDAISLSRGESSHSGKQSLRIVFTKNENYGGTWRKADSRHIFTRFYDYYGEGFDSAAGMKIHRM